VSVKIKMAIVQLTRIGDVIQTFQAASQLKLENPNVELTLIARKKFADGIMFLLEQTFDNIVLLDTQNFFQKKNDLNKVRANVHNWIFDLKKFEFNIVINLSFCKTSSFLTTLLRPKVTMGIHRNERSQLAINDKWSQYIYSNVMATPNCPFNLVDIYKNMLGAKDAHISNYNLKQENQIVIHPFASSQKKSWGPNKWVELIYKLLKENNEMKIIIVGSKLDKENANRITQSPSLQFFADRIFDKTEVNSVEDSFNNLCNSKLFIGHDSMVSHLAAIIRLPSIVISLGTVRPHETTPYSDNVINVAPKNKCFPCTVETSCDLLPCHGSINHQVIHSIAQAMLNNEDVSHKLLTDRLSSFHLDSVRIYKPTFDDVGMQLNEISQNNDTMASLSKTYFRILWSYYLSGKDTSDAIPKLNDETTKTLANAQVGVNYLYELYTYGMKFCNRVIDESEATNPNVANIQENVKKITEIDELCNITKNTYPMLAPIIDFFYVNKANAPGENIVDIAKNNLLSYYEGSSLMSVLNELIDKTLAPHTNRHNAVEKDM